MKKPFEESIAKYGYSEADKAKLLEYIEEYYLCEKFRDAGHYVLHGLPDHDNDAETTAHIDYSLRGPFASRSFINRIHDIHVNEINKYLRGLWENHDLVGSDSFLRAQLETDWTIRENGEQFQLKLGQPHVEALCTSEAILYISVEEVESLLTRSSK